MTRQPGQPPGRRGTVGHAYSALNLRLMLALFGLALMILFAVLLARADQVALAFVAIALGVVAMIDIAVVIRRIRVRRRRDPGRRYSLFE
ncbi:DUF6343 family protein [Phytohabitans kaempferiae]|uniref:DUF6343 family protein n=1 Tax=Phytohabitans kaempferiae TaxID=1620943 RepID=A0ABV6LXE5_9ACTN